MHKPAWIPFLLCVVFFSQPVFAENKGPGEYPGVADPFADPAQYEFSDEEKDDKEFFHLGRFLLLGFDVGAGIFTGGLGSSTGPGVLAGAHLVYFFDKSLSLEVRGTFSNHLDQVRNGGGGGADIDTTLMGFTGGFRYYFDTKAAPRAIAIANPYLGIGGGVFSRSQVVVAGAATGLVPSTNFGMYGGAGVQFMIYRNHVYLGVDLRYQMVFFNDENSTLGGIALQGDREGDYVTTAMTLTYSF